MSLPLCAFVSNLSAQDKEQPFTLLDITRMMRQRVGRDMTEADLAYKIEKLGITFAPTPEMISRLRTNGAHQTLINTIKRIADKNQASAMGAKVIDNSAASNDQFIIETGKVVREYLDELPDFICNEVIERYYDIEGTGAWDRGDTLTYELTYNRKQETYKSINTIGKALTKDISEVGGATSTGDWASRLSEIFNPESKTSFKVSGKEKLGNRETLLYDFKVNKDNSKLTVKSQSGPQFISGYSGTLWIESDSKKVLRLDLALDDLPKSATLSSVDNSIDYDYVKLKGLDIEFLLPIKAELVMISRTEKTNFRNLIYFKFYRKFESDIKIIDQ